MKQNKNKKKWVTAAVSLASVALLAGTFAWFQSQDSQKNHFEGSIAGNDVEVVETFTPPTEWPPGTDVNKDVAILNSGDYQSMIRVSFDEVLTKLKDAAAKTSADPSTILAGKTKKEIELLTLNESQLAKGTWKDATISPAKTFTVADGEYAGTYTLKAKEQEVTNASGTTYRYVSYWDNGTDKYYAKANGYSRDEVAGTITPASAEIKYVDLASTELPKDWTNPVYAPTFTVNADGTTVIDANSDDKIKLHFVNMSTTPTANKWFFNAADGNFYFVGIIEPGAQTEQLLDFVELASTADNTYSKFQFDLTVNATGIQATKEAVNSTDWVNNTNATLVTALEGLY